MRIIFTIVCLICLFQIGYATDYYLANHGNDNNNGTSIATPWKTLQKLSLELGGPNGNWSLTINAGDRIFFNRGDIFEGSITLKAYNNQEISFGAYGSGANPILKGSVLTSNWVQHSGNIWKTAISQEVQLLFLEDSLQTLARFPNKGVLFVETANSTQLTNYLIGSSNLNFVGANVMLREYEWRNNRQVVNAQMGNTVSWANNINSADSMAYFYFDNKINLLDTVGEWFYDKNDNTLYFMTDGSNPNTLHIEASVFLQGISGMDNRFGCTFTNLHFKQFADFAIFLSGNSFDTDINNCAFSQNFQGIFLGGNTCKIQNCTFENSYLQGIVTANSANSVFSDNLINHTGMRFGTHRPGFIGEFYPNAFYQINGNPGCRIEKNEINYAGYNGIKFIGNGITVKHNIITNTCINMSDGGAIYTYGANSYNCVVEANFIHHVIGDYKGTTPNGIAIGIYIDNFAHNITILQNTITDIPKGGGVTINAGSYDNLISNNTFYKVNSGIGFADWMTGKSVYNNILQNNKFINNAATSAPIEVMSDDQNYAVFTVSDNNQFYNLHDSIISRHLWSLPQTFSLIQWQLAFNLDLNSVLVQYNWPDSIDITKIIFNYSDTTQTYQLPNGSDMQLNPISSVNVAAYSSFVYIDNTPLPVTFTQLSAKNIENNRHQINWQTASEKSLALFEIEHFQDNKFVKIGKISPKNQPSSYQFIYDFFDKIIPKTSFYRVKSIDLDGTVSYSKIAQVTNFNQGLKPYLFPNPTKNSFQIANNQEIELIKFIDLTGRTIFVSNERNVVYLIPNIANGIYLIELHLRGKNIEYHKLMVEN